MDEAALQNGLSALRLRAGYLSIHTPGFDGIAFHRISVLAGFSRFIKCVLVDSLSDPDFIHSKRSRVLRLNKNSMQAYLKLQDK